MKLAGIHRGDIVRAEGTYWQVTGRDGRELICTHLQSRSAHRFHGADIQEHWAHRVRRGTSRYIEDAKEVAHG